VLVVDQPRLIMYSSVLGIGGGTEVVGEICEVERNDP
jgi:hypothetical protein